MVSASITACVPSFTLPHLQLSPHQGQIQDFFAGGGGGRLISKKSANFQAKCKIKGPLFVDGGGGGGHYNFELISKKSANFQAKCKIKGHHFLYISFNPNKWMGEGREEFMIIGTPQQTSKLDVTSRSTTIF